MLLHHSQTICCKSNESEEAGILCFYIILKLHLPLRLITAWLVSYAFTSFSNSRNLDSKKPFGWYLMLLHHSQTSIKRLRVTLVAGILCFYIILKQVRETDKKITRLVSYAFTSFSNTNCNYKRYCHGWYLMLLHHSQTSK